MPSHCKNTNCPNCCEVIHKEDTTHNHMFSLAFSVDSKFKDGWDCLENESEEVLSRLMERIAGIIQEGVAKSEAFGCDDTYEIPEKDHNRSKNA